MSVGETIRVPSPEEFAQMDLALQMATGHSEVGQSVGMFFLGQAIIGLGDWLYRRLSRQKIGSLSEIGDPLDVGPNGESRYDKYFQ